MIDLTDVTPVCCSHEPQEGLDVNVLVYHHPHPTLSLSRVIWFHFFFLIVPSLAACSTPITSEALLASDNLLVRPSCTETQTQKAPQLYTRRYLHTASILKLLFW